MPKSILNQGGIIKLDLFFGINLDYYNNHKKIPLLQLKFAKLAN